MRSKRKELVVEQLESRQLLTGVPHDLACVAGDWMLSESRAAELVIGDLADDHGDDAGTATPFVLSGQASGTLETYGDVDWFSFDAQAGHTYDFSTSLGTLSDSVLRIVDTDGITELAFNDDFGFGFASQISWVAPKTGQYYVEVSGYFGDTGSYWLVGQSDDHGDSSLASTPIGVNATIEGELETIGDVDWFNFTASEGDRYRFTTTLDTLSDSYLRLIDTDGQTVLAVSDDFVDLSSRLDWIAPSSGTYYLEVSGYGSSTGSYQLNTELRGDINQDGIVDASDIDQLYAIVAAGTGDVRSDLNDSHSVDHDDVDYLLRTILHTNYGDANLDGTFDSTDLVEVFTAGEYQDTIPSNSTWAEGDWNGDGEFDSSDLVIAFGYGNYGDDDGFENNDTLATAANLGTIDTTRTFDSLRLLDAQDWYRFQTDRVSDGSGHISVQFDHSVGDIDIQLFDASGQLVRQSTDVTNIEQVSLNGLAVGEYYLRVYGYEGARNDSYVITIDPGQAVDISGDNLWLNFDGASISTSQLATWSTDWDFSWTELDPEQDGIIVNQFLAGTPGYGQREAIINQIIANVQQDLSPYGITVRRWNGSAVAGQGDTTIFVGASTLFHPHVAGDIDYGNNNLTDIAFVGNEWWGDASSTALALSDVVLHEAGHTYGLFHVDTRVGSIALAESMGLRYSESTQSLWVQNTSFMDRTFVEYLNHGGGRGSQNAHRTMLQNFGLANSPSASELFRYSSDSGVFSFVASAGADVIQGHQLEGGIVELDINGHQFLLGEGIEQVRIYTNGDTRDQIQLDSDLGIDVVFDHTVAGDLAHVSKVADSLVAAWNGTSFDVPDDEHAEYEEDLPVHRSTAADERDVVLAALASDQQVDAMAVDTVSRHSQLELSKSEPHCRIVDSCFAAAVVESLFDAANSRRDIDDAEVAIASLVGGCEDGFGVQGAA